MANPLLQYGYLQLLDLLTTLAFLLHGVQEGNPVVRIAMALLPHPIWGLVAVKCAALGLGIYCWWNAKFRLLDRVNLMFAVLIAWNLVALILGTVFHNRLA